MTNSWSFLAGGAVSVAFFALVGTIVLFAAFKIFDWAFTRIDMEEEIKKGNMAVAILASAVMLGLSIIIAAAING